MSDIAETPEARSTAHRQTVGQVADAVQGNWVDRLAPAWTRPYLRLSRADRPVGTWLLYLPCLWGVTLAAASTGFRWFDLWIVLGCGIGAFLMRGAGCTWNDITDRNFDGEVARTRSRPIPSGQVTVAQAVFWMVVQSLAAFLILITFNMNAILMGVGSLALVAIYPFAKRFTWWPQIFLGLAFNWGAMLAWVAHTGSLTLAPVLMYLAGIAWTVFYDTIYAHQDKEDDALIGIKSTARLFGEDTPYRLRQLLLGATALMVLAALLALLRPAGGAAAFLGLAGALGFAFHMAWQLSQLDTDDNDRCLSLFRSNRDAGLIPVLCFGLAILA
ncbi:4-hydroxybenzoate octaprenyltransferase [Rhodovulum sp. MB263]|uniref:4-hydroxybenzoate octaprenyltransferase n=1 Tax=unclassified Rhodovulum TaxID=2631432 RepID=UPI0009B793E5|nr:4-hydroxybenzoate octaprenyltransferase [Rhodovulum sp. MB263]ARC89563.1 4-hydroxybenzoate polyprenyltransferase [Rhodovulum sp. MB263]